MTRKPKRTPSTAGRKSGNHLLDSRRVVAMLQAVSKHGGVGHAELREAVGVSRSTLTRMITVTRAQLGVDLRWRKPKTAQDIGEYWIADWGVFDATKVMNFKTG